MVSWISDVLLGAIAWCQPYWQLTLYVLIIFMKQNNIMTSFIPPRQWYGAGVLNSCLCTVGTISYYKVNSIANSPGIFRSHLLKGFKGILSSKFMHVQIISNRFLYYSWLTDMESSLWLPTSLCLLAGQQQPQCSPTERFVIFTIFCQRVLSTSTFGSENGSFHS